MELEKELQQINRRLEEIERRLDMERSRPSSAKSFFTGFFAVFFIMTIVLFIAVGIIHFITTQS
ncbi:hypothetical protein [Paenibacillus ginsengihumi]|uniref:hypothetical protein n=1 Tax=Paenibacillus ginsengihumi TaxID=431596 RepID=UPI000368C678|nr:hypothetical protein [Paenibacillus ginsengihumi]